VWSDTGQNSRSPHHLLDSKCQELELGCRSPSLFWHRFLRVPAPTSISTTRAVVDEIKDIRVSGLDSRGRRVSPSMRAYLVERAGTNGEELLARDAHPPESDPGGGSSAIARLVVLLAEANSLPDARSLFRQGDECHMAFHFPRCRDYSWLGEEDREPIVDIHRGRPSATCPKACQWVIVLRHHDELPLDM